MSQPTDPKVFVFWLDEGPVELHLPRTLSPESFQILSEWWNLILKNAERSVRDEALVAAVDEEPPER